MVLPLALRTLELPRPRHQPAPGGVYYEQLLLLSPSKISWPQPTASPRLRLLPPLPCPFLLVPLRKDGSKLLSGYRCRKVHLSALWNKRYKSLPPCRLLCINKSHLLPTSFPLLFSFLILFSQLLFLVLGGGESGPFYILFLLPWEVFVKRTWTNLC